MVAWISYTSVILLALTTYGEVRGQTPSDHVSKVTCHQPLDSKETIYDFKFKDIYGRKTLSLSKLKDRVVLIVNIATYCDYTWQYHGLRDLQERFEPYGLTILAFPCNQFGRNQPGDNGTEIMNGIMYVRPGGGFEPNFPHMEPVHVNGAKEAGLYTYLKTYCPTTFMEFHKDIHYKPLRVGDVFWNWEKFLVDVDGRVVSRYHSSLDPLDITLVEDVFYELKKRNSPF